MLYRQQKADLTRSSYSGLLNRTSSHPFRGMPAMQITTQRHLRSLDNYLWPNTRSEKKASPQTYPFNYPANHVALQKPAVSNMRYATKSGENACDFVEVDFYFQLKSSSNSTNSFIETHRVPSKTLFSIG